MVPHHRRLLSRILTRLSHPRQGMKLADLLSWRPGWTAWLWWLGFGLAERLGDTMRRFLPISQKRIPEAAAIALTLTFVLTIAIGTTYVNKTAWVQHTLEVQTRIAAIWSRLQDAEIGQRSFVLTGDERFLEPFESGSNGLTNDLDGLANLVADNPEQVAAVAEVRPLIAQRIALAQKTIEMRRTGSFEEARAEVLKGDGLAAMRELRGEFQRMQQTEAALLEVRTASAQKAIYALSAALLVLFLGTVAALTSWIINQRRTSKELADTNDALKQSIADREAAELQMRQMQKMEAVGQLTGGIAHDFNNMLAVIISGISLARKRLANGQAGATELLASAIDGANRAAALVKKLLAFSRQQPLEPQAIDANKFVAGMSDLTARALGETIRMETVLGGGLWATLADPVQLETAVLNLCVNARDAMPNGGRLTLETTNCYLDDRYARLHPGVPAEQYVLIAVTDTGVGMSDEVLSKAFDPFFTTKPPGMGTGLGLSQVFGFVKQSGGHIKIYSERGQGTTVKLYLPRHAGAVADLSRAPAAIEHRGEETILVVEDDPSVLALTATALRELGYTVFEASHANGAVHHLKNGSKPDLLLTDIVMPDVNGRALAEQAAALCPQIKILFMTGFTRNAIVHNGVLDAGVHLFAKPFSIEELSVKIREVLQTTVQK
jgi:signal transduction histidine kinase/ActR/RegA family two-component response regulator